MHKQGIYVGPQWNLIIVLLAVAVLGLGLVGCGERSSTQEPVKSAPLKVLAAASLTELLPQIDSAARYQFGGTNELDMQIREGIDADVLVSANEKIPEKLFQDGLAKQPVPIAANRIILIVPKESKLGSLDDLAQDKTAKIVMAGEDVPIGAYTRKVLKALGRDEIVARAASYERDVKAVHAKVSLGEADAGFVYITDALASPENIRIIELPKTAQNHALYVTTVLSKSRNRAAAEKFVDRLTSTRAQKLLKDAGFELAP